MVLMIDPPSGWKHGFPKPYTKKEGQSMEDWLRQEKLPEDLVQLASQWGCRFWEEEEE